MNLVFKDTNNSKLQRSNKDLSKIIWNIPQYGGVSKHSHSKCGYLLPYRYCTSAKSIPKQNHWKTFNIPKFYNIFGKTSWGKYSFSGYSKNFLINFWGDTCGTYQTNQDWKDTLKASEITHWFSALV